MPPRRQPTEVMTITHLDDARRNIATAEMEPVMDNTDLRPIHVGYARRNRDLDPQLVWRGKDEQDMEDLIVAAPPLFIQEKVHPKVLVDDLMRLSRGNQQPDEYQVDLFADFNGLHDPDARTEFYQHEQNWSNRMILGDSLQVMASLSEREGLRGKVQCIYIDPPYGIRFNSNFQWSTTSRTVTDGKREHITRDPEQVKAFRDTWRDGIHSYLSYLRDRLTVARDLLTESGSVFVQIGDENMHRVRAVMDEVFGDDKFVAMIYFQTAANQNTNRLQRLFDCLLWYRRGESLKYRETFRDRTKSEIEGVFTAVDEISGERYKPTQIKNAKQRVRVKKAGRLTSSGRYWKRKISDNPYVKYNNVWTGTIESTFSKDKIYVVQTNKNVIERCILMTTDPGDLVLDPTCGSGTTAYLAEQWGRRWITVDTSRVALALTRARIMGGRYPYYLLADSPQGQQKETEIRHQELSDSPTYGNIRQGFVYERVPHITLGKIANNAEIDVIWDEFQKKLEPLRSKLNKVLKKSWEEWEIPRATEDGWSRSAKKVHSDWWKARIDRQNEIDASIADNADVMYLYNKPYKDNRKERVAGPFTVESLSPHHVLAADDNHRATAEAGKGYHYDGKVPERDFATLILDNLKTSGVQQSQKTDKIDFIAVTGWPGEYICAEGRYMEGDIERRAGIFIGPEFGTVTRPALITAAREAADMGCDVLVACAFSYDAHATNLNRLGALKVLQARMNADLHMADTLKNDSKGNLFVIFGEPDIELQDAGGDMLRVKINGVDIYHPATGQVRSDDTDGIACWFIDTDYNEESFFVRHAYFLGAGDPYKVLKTTLKAEIDPEAWNTLRSDVSRPFARPSSGRIAVKVINHLGDEVMKVVTV